MSETKQLHEGERAVLCSNIRQAMFHLASCWDALRDAESITAGEIEVDDISYLTSALGEPADAFQVSEEDIMEALGDAVMKSCPKCGGQVTRGEAYTDEGEGEEAGRTFYYCSEHCRETH